MARNNQRRSKNNNPEGRNQYSSGFVDLARERPLTTAAVAAGAAATGLFLWSRRSQISDQLSNLSDQIGEWSQQGFGSGDPSSGSSGQFGDDTGGFATSGTSGSRSTATRGSSGKSRGGSGKNRSQQQIAEDAMSMKETGGA